MIAKWHWVRYNYHRTYEEHDDDEEEYKGLYEMCSYVWTVFGKMEKSKKYINEHI